MNRKITQWKGVNVWLIGASDGIGKALAIQLLKLGANVTLSSRRKEKCDEIAQPFSNAQVKVVDVLDREAIKEIALQLTDLDLVIYMAADYSPQSSDKLDTELASRMIDINLKGAIAVSAAVTPVFLKKGKGHLSLVASIAGLVGLPQSSIYGATKAAIINFAESLYFDLHHRGIDVSIINPGFVKTRLTEKNTFEMPSIITPEEAADYIVKGYAKGCFANSFPFAFSLFFRFLRILPYSLHFKLMQKIIKL